MAYEVVKNRIEDETIRVDYCNDDLAVDTIEGNHFGLPVYRRNYPSCYQYNVTIMLAKRLIKEEANRVSELRICSTLGGQIRSSESEFPSKAQACLELIKEEKEKACRFTNRLHLDKKLLEKVFISEEQAV